MAVSSRKSLANQFALNLGRDILATFPTNSEINRSSGSTVVSIAVNYCWSIVATAAAAGPVAVAVVIDVVALDFDCLEDAFLFCFYFQFILIKYCFCFLSALKNRFSFFYFCFVVGLNYFQHQKRNPRSSTNNAQIFFFFLNFGLSFIHNMSRQKTRFVRRWINLLLTSTMHHTLSKYCAVWNFESRKNQMENNFSPFFHIYLCRSELFSSSEKRVDIFVFVEINVVSAKPQTCVVRKISDRTGL